MTEDANAGHGDCSEVLHRIYEYLDGEMSADDVRRVAAHLGECQPCLAEHDLDVALKQVVRRSCSMIEVVRQTGQQPDRFRQDHLVMVVWPQGRALDQALDRAGQIAEIPEGETQAIEGDCGDPGVSAFARQRDPLFQIGGRLLRTALVQRIEGEVAERMGRECEIPHGEASVERFTQEDRRAFVVATEPSDDAEVDQRADLGRHGAARPCQGQPCFEEVFAMVKEIMILGQGAGRNQCFRAENRRHRITRGQSLFQPPTALRDVCVAQGPELDEWDPEAEGGDGIALGREPGHRGAHVRVVGLDSIRPPAPVVSARRVLPLLDQFETPVRVTAASGSLVGAGGELFQAELSDRLEHDEPGLAGRALQSAQKALGDQRRDAVKDGGGQRCGAEGDKAKALRGRGGDATGRSPRLRSPPPLQPEGLSPSRL